MIVNTNISRLQNNTSPALKHCNKHTPLMARRASDQQAQPSKTSRVPVRLKGNEWRIMASVPLAGTTPTSTEEKQEAPHTSVHTHTHAVRGCSSNFGATLPHRHILDKSIPIFGIVVVSLYNLPADPRGRLHLPCLPAFLLVLYAPAAKLIDHLVENVF